MVDLGGSPALQTIHRRICMTLALAVLALAACADGNAQIPVQRYEIANRYPHDPSAFTQGLSFHNGEFYESTGQYGQSDVRRVRLSDGTVQNETDLDPRLFGEGSTILGDRLYSLSWCAGMGQVWRLDDLEPVGSFRYPGQGWGLTDDGEQLILSDGTAELRFIDPDSFSETRRITVTADNRPVANLNELEFIDGEVYANIWQQELIVRIDPESGDVVGVIDMTGLGRVAGARGFEDVLNGIAHDPETGRLFVTGKYWPELFEITLLPDEDRADGAALLANIPPRSVSCR